MAEGLKPINLKNIQITDTLFGTYSKLVAEKIIPYQWDILNDRVNGAMPTHCINNFRIAAGDMVGSHKGVIFQDTDLYKWIEAVAYCIANGSGSKYENIVDDVIELIGRAQQKDGYLNTYFTLVSPEKQWSNLVEGHELYCAGHLIEAAVAYFSATGKKKLLGIAIKLADLICKTFGRDENQMKGYPGHQEIELALIKLYRVTKEKRYLFCARYFIDERGSEPNYFRNEIHKRGGYEFFQEFDNYDLSYSQAHVPPVEQRSAEGHAVRAMYMYSAMADLALEYDDSELAKACRQLWESVTKKRMYVTGSIGTSGFLERFTSDYDLPNNTNYSETCASIGLMMFGQRMNALTKESSYYDVVEYALYNTVLAGINVTGDRYFYVNPLEVVPEFCKDHTYMMHVKPSRQRWFSVACCPPNLARTLASLGHYIFAQDNNTIYINQFISSKVQTMIDSASILINLESTILHDGKIKLIIEPSDSSEICIKIRIPSYAGQVKTILDNKEIDLQKEDGYANIRISGQKIHDIEIDFDVKPRWISANSNVRADVGKIALVKGPCVYCLEEIDNGKNLTSIYVEKDANLQEDEDLKIFGGLPTFRYNGIRLMNEGIKEGELYGIPRFKEIPVTLRAVPYCFWNNRGEGEMLVWQKVKI